MGTEANKATWRTSDGGQYEFFVYGPDANWRQVGGVYIFSYHDGAYWRPLYVGETDDFSQRLPNHERWGDAQKAGATHIHVRVEAQEASRVDLEQKLIQGHQPPLNVLLR